MREFILDAEKKINFPVKVTFDDGAFSLHDLGDGEYKLRIYSIRNGDETIDDTLLYDRQQLRCLFYILSV